MKKLVLLTAALLAGFAFAGTPASAADGLEGYWLIKYYNKNGKLTSQQCIIYVQTNNIVGYTKYSGTWAEVGNPNLAGQWIQTGDDIMWYGASGNNSFFSVGDMTSNKSIGGTGFAQFQNTTSGTVAAGNWTGKKTKNCKP